MKEKFIEFYINKFDFLKSVHEAKIDFIPAIMRRRLSNLDKMTLSTMNAVISDDVQNIVFSSQNGEVEKLLKIIEQYKTEKEVSPNIFSGSVHNFSASFFLLNNKKSVPYNAVSACGNSLSAGFLTAVISNYQNTLFCYSDIYDDDLISVSLNLSKNKQNGAEKYRIIFEKNEKTNDEFDDYVKLFSGETKFLKSKIYTVERVEDENSFN